MAKIQSTAVWVELDPTTLSQGCEAAYLRYKALYQQMKAQRIAFEELMNEEAQSEAQVPKGKKMVFGYNFGKLSVAVVDDEGKKATTNKKAQSLSDYLKAQSSR